MSDLSRDVRTEIAGRANTAGAAAAEPAPV